MFFIAFFGILAVSSALPAQQILTPAATLTAIPATNHILILTPQAQVQLEPSLKYPAPLVQHLAPVARIDGSIDQTVVYVPNENIIKAFPKAIQQSKQLETTNITNVVNQFVSAGQTVQAELQALQQQLAQGLENIIEPGQKMEGSLTSGDMNLGLAAGQFPETPRPEAGRFYSVPAAIPQFYSNFEVIHSPLNPVFTIQPLQTIRARSVVHQEDKINANVPGHLENLNLANIAGEGVHLKSQESENQVRNTESLEVPAQQPHTVQKEYKQEPVHSQFGKFLGSLEKRDTLSEALLESNFKDANVDELKEPGSELVSIAEALPAGLAISGEGGLAQAKPIGSAITGKDGIAYSAPSGTAIAGSSENEKVSKSS